MTDKTTEALKLALEYCDDNMSAEAANVLRMALADRIANTDKMVGCAYCDNPLFAGTKCKNCGRVTLAEPVKQEPVAWMVIGDGQHGVYKAGEHFDSIEYSSYWNNRGYELVPVYAEPVSAEAIRAEAVQEYIDSAYEKQRKHMTGYAEPAMVVRGSNKGHRYVELYKAGDFPLVGTELYYTQFPQEFIRAEALEEAAKVCESMIGTYLSHERCASAIRSLK